MSLFLAEVKKQVPSVEEGEVLRPLMKCYTALEVSSNKGDVSRYSSFFCDMCLCSYFGIIVEYFSEISGSPFLTRTYINVLRQVKPKNYTSGGQLEELEVERVGGGGGL